MSVWEARANYINSTTSALQRYVVAGDKYARQTKMKAYVPEQQRDADISLYKRLLADEQKTGPGKMPERSSMLAVTSSDTGWGRKHGGVSGVSSQPWVQIFHHNNFDRSETASQYEERMSNYVSDSYHSVASAASFQSAHSNRSSNRPITISSDGSSVRSIPSTQAPSSRSGSVAATSVNSGLSDQSMDGFAQLIPATRPQAFPVNRPENLAYMDDGLNAPVPDNPGIQVMPGLFVHRIRNVNHPIIR